MQIDKIRRSLSKKHQDLISNQPDLDDSDYQEPDADNGIGDDNTQDARPYTDNDDPDNDGDYDNYDNYDEPQEPDENVDDQLFDQEEDQPDSDEDLSDDDQGQKLIIDGKEINVEPQKKIEQQIELVAPQAPIKIQNKPIVEKAEKSYVEQKIIDQQENQTKFQHAKLWRRLARIFFLIVLIGFIIFAFIFVHKYLSSYRDFVKIEPNSKITLNLTNCQLNMIDFNRKDTYRFFDFNPGTKIEKFYQLLTTSFSDPELVLQYYLPGKMNIDFTSDLFSKFNETINKTLNTYDYMFLNVLEQSTSNCHVNMFVFKPFIMDQLNVTCYGECAIIIDSELLRIKDLSLDGSMVDLNAIDLRVDSADLKSVKGQFQLNHFQFSKHSNLMLEEGDIIIQSPSSVSINFTHSVPGFCFGSPFSKNYQLTACEEPTQEQIEAYLNQGTEKKKEKGQKNKTDSEKGKGETAGFHFKKHKDEPQQAQIDYFKPSCFGRVDLCVDAGCSDLDRQNKILNLTNKFGSLYTNIIKKKGFSLEKEADLITYQKHFKKGQVDWSISSQKTLKQYLEKSDDPKNFDPTFVLHLGSKATQSGNFQQWQLTTNPAYSYLKPWRMSTFSFNLMTSASYFLRLGLNPGFCPYIPELSINSLYMTQSLVEKTFVNKTKKMLTFSWQDQLTMPQSKISDFHVDSGLRKVFIDRNNPEKWYSLQQTNKTHFQTKSIKLGTSTVTLMAVIISLILCFIFGTSLVFGVLYGINAIYITIVEHNSVVDKYAKIDKQSNTENGTESGEQKDEKKSKDKLTLSMNPIHLIGQLFGSAPPISAFLDYLIIFISKKYINSVVEFYNLLFEEVAEGSNEDIHNTDKDQLLGYEMKTLYEKFCYLNGYLEKKLDDKDNKNLLTQRGFKIEVKNDVLTQCYAFISYKGEIVQLSSMNQERSLNLFINNCCKQSKFDTDYIEQIEFDNLYEEFCILNHLQKELISEAELKTNFGIQTTFKPQQWLMRDTTQKEERVESKWRLPCRKRKQVYNIKKQKLVNLFNLLLNKPDAIETSEEFSQAQQSLIQYTYWQAVDFFSVVAHIISIIILASPPLGIAMLYRISYSPYSLLPGQFLITSDDLFYNFFELPYKLYYEEVWMKHTVFGILCFWAYAILDLMYYYISMEIPQQNFFKKTEQKKEEKNEILFLFNMHTYQMIFRQLMWCFVLLSCFFALSYFALGLVWLILGAIVNPTAFLPYATAASTFITVVSGKFAQFTKIAEDGLTQVFDYVKKIAEEQMNGMMKKMHITEKVEAALNSDALKAVTSQATKFGLVDEKTLQELESKAVQMSKNPVQAAKEASKELQEIIDDPEKFAKEIMKQVETKAFQILQEKLEKQVKNGGRELSDSLFSIYKQNWPQLKINLQDLLYQISYNEEFKSENLQVLLKSDKILNLLWEIAFPIKKECSSDEFLQNILTILGDLLVELVGQATNDHRVYEFFQPKVIEKIVMIILALEKKDHRALESNILALVDCEDENFEGLSRFKHIFSLGLHLMQSRKITFNKIFNIVEEFFGQLKNEEMKFVVPILNIFQILVNVFKNQAKAQTTKDIKQVFDDLFKYLKDQNPQLLQDISHIDSSGMTMMVNFMRQNFNNIPGDILKEYLQKVCQHSDIQLFEENNKSEKNKKIVKTFQSMFELLSLIINDQSTILNDLRQVGEETYGIDSSTVKFLKIVFTLKFRELVTGFDIQQLQSLDMFDQIVKPFKIEKQYLAGVLGLITGKTEIQECYLLLDQILKLKKLYTPTKSSTYLDLYNLFTSTDPSKLHFTLIKLGIPPQYSVLLLINRRVVSPNFISVQQLVQLKLIEDNETTIQDFKTMFPPEKVYTDEKEFRKYRDHLNKCLQKLVDQEAKEILEQKSPKNPEVQGGKPAQTKLILLNLLHKGPIQKLSEQLKKISNNVNGLAKWTDQDFNVLQKVLTLRNVEFGSQNFSSDAKQAIEDFCWLLNLNKDKLEHFVRLFITLKPEKFTQALQALEIPQVQLATLENYIEYALLKMEFLQNSQKFIDSKLLSSLKLNKQPTTQYLRKLIFQSNGSIDLNTIYTFVSWIDETGSYEDKILPIVNFINGTIDNDEKTYSKDGEIIEERGQFKYLLGLRQGQKEDYYQGVLTLMEMLNETSDNGCRNILFDHFMRAGENCEAYMIFSCLYAFFTGKSLGIKLQLEEDGEQKSKDIVQYLSEKLQLPVEFFEVLHIFYTNDTMQYTKTYLKYQRRLGSIQSKNQKPSQENIQGQEQQKEGNLAQPTQSLIQIPEKIINNLLLFVSGQNFTSMYFSKEFKWQLEQIDFMSIMMNLKQSKTSEQRMIIYDQLGKQQSSQQVLQRLGIQKTDFINILKLMHQDYPDGDYNWIQKSFKLSSKQIDSDLIQSILQLDINLEPMERNIRKNSDLLGIKIKECSLITDVEKMGLNPKWVKVANYLARGDFTLINYLDQDIRYFSIPDSAKQYKEQILGVLQGICGVIACNYESQPIQIDDFMQQLYNKLYLTYKTEDKYSKTIDQNILQEGNYRRYAIYQLVNNLRLDPMWTLLMLGDVDTFVQLQNIYESKTEDPYQNPLTVLQVVLYFRSLHPFAKDILATLEWFENLQQLKNDKYLKKNLSLKEEELSGLFQFNKEKLEEYQEFRENILRNIFFQETYSLNEAALQSKFPMTQLDQILVIEHIRDAVNRTLYCCIEDICFEQIDTGEENKKPDVQFYEKLSAAIIEKSQIQYDNIEEAKAQHLPLILEVQQFFSELEEDEYFSEQNNLTLLENVQKQLYPKCLKKIFNSIQNLFIDPRDEENQNEFNEKRAQQYFVNENAQFYNLGVLSSLSTLNTAYQGHYGFQDLQESHYLYAAFSIDFVLSTIEKFTYFETKSDYLPKNRIFTIVGLAAGFCFNTDNLIKASVDHNLISYVKYNDLDAKSRSGFNFAKQKELKINKSTWVYLNKTKWKIDNLQETFFTTDVGDQKFKIYDYYSSYLNMIEYFYEDASTYLYSQYINHSYAFDELLTNMDFPQEFLNQAYVSSLDRAVVDFQNREECLLGYHQAYYFKNTLKGIDVRSAVSWEEVATLQREYSNSVNDSKFLLLMDLFKRNYSSLLSSDSYIKETYPQAVDIIFGLIALNGCAGISYKKQALEQYLTPLITQLNSNLTVLTELIAPFVNSYEGVSSISTVLGCEETLFQAFFEIALNNRQSMMPNIEILVRAYQLSDQEKGFLANICSAYILGDMKEFQKVLDNSQVGKYYNDKGEIVGPCPQDALKKILWSFHFSQFHKMNNINWNTFDIFNRTSLSPNEYKNKKLMYLLLWQVSVQVCSKPQSIPKELLLEHYDESQQKKSERKKIQVIGKLLSTIVKFSEGDFSYLLQGMLQTQQIGQQQEAIDQETQRMLQILKLLGLVDTLENFENIQFLTQFKLDKIYASDLREQIIQNNEDLVALIAKSTPFQQIDSNLQTCLAQLLVGVAHDDFTKITGSLHAYGKGSGQSELMEFACIMQSLYIWNNSFKMLLAFEKFTKDKQGENATPRSSQFKQLLDKADLMKVLIQSFYYKDKENESIQNVEQYQLLNNSDIDYIKQLNKEFQKEQNSWFVWTQSLKAFLVEANAVEEDPNLRIYNDIFTGMIFVDTKYLLPKGVDQQGNVTKNIPQTFMEFYQKCFFLIRNGAQSVQNLQQEIPSGVGVFKDYFPNAAPYIDTLEQFINMFICIQCNKQEKGQKKLSLMEIPQIKHCLLNLFYQLISSEFPDEPNHRQSGEQPRQRTLKDSVQDLFFLITGFDLATLKPNTNKQQLVQINQVSDNQEKIIRFSNLLTDTVFKDEELRRYLSPQILLDVFRFLNQLSGFKTKDLTDKNFQKKVKDLLYAISGQPRQTQQNFVSSKIDALEERKPLIQLPMPLIEAIFGLTQGDINTLGPFLKEAGLGEAKIKLLMKVLEEVKELGIFGEQKPHQIKQSKLNNTLQNDEKMTEVMRKVQEGKASSTDLFMALDQEGDQSNSISKAEFHSLSKRMGMNLTQHRINEIFADVKKHSNNASSEDLDEKEFKTSLDYLQNKNAMMTLESLGISQSMLYLSLIFLSVVLLLLFAFIFVGIEAFALGGSFGAIINSLIPIASGAGAGGSQQDKSEALKPEKLNNSVDQTKEIIESDSL